MAGLPDVDSYLREFTGRRARAGKQDSEARGALPGDVLGRLGAHRDRAHAPENHIGECVGEAGQVLNQFAIR